MPVLHIEHQIIDLDTWLQTFARFAPARERARATSAQVFHPEDDARYSHRAPWIRTAQAATNFRSYLDMAMSLSRRDPEEPYRRTAVKLGDEQFAAEDRWTAAGRLALVGIGVEPGLSDVSPGTPPITLSTASMNSAPADGSNLTVDGYDFAPSFSIWTRIEECLNPPVIWEADRGWYTSEPFSGPEIFDFPDGIGPVDHGGSGHVRIRARWGVHRRAQDAAQTGAGPHREVNGRQRSGQPARCRRGVPAVPATLGPVMHGKTCAGV
jgi:saccharopine dehydrogenase (NAD+, L-lysine forming)